MIRSTPIDAAAMLALERHETDSHAIPSREVRDLGDALMLYDDRDPDPFWNRMARVRWPSDPAAFDRRLAEAMALFLVLGRRPHVWPSPVHAEPTDLAARLASNGFQDVGGGHLMVLTAPESCGPVRPGDAGPDVTLRAIRSAADAVPADPDVMAGVLADSFGALPGRIPELAADLRATLDDPRIALAIAQVDGVPASVAKATTFSGHSYVSSVGTRPRFRGMGLAALVTRHVLAAAGTRETHTVYLGVFSGNRPAHRLYERLGFVSIGESPDLLLE
ncbi:MAG: GNAT family N-acetyltransferase [Chloroflexi bacterium]|nr:GNAT family N-acetyltransferase [Chloroflexota bacterium]